MATTVCACTVDRTPTAARRAAQGTDEPGDTGDGDGDTSVGDGDGDTSTGDGDGDGDMATGDGDGDTGTAGMGGDGDSGVPVDKPKRTCADDCTTGADCDALCDDGTFCNGSERCLPSRRSADPYGCVAGVPACDSNEICTEATRSCELDCELAGDLDSDGYLSQMCGGPDCDDGNGLIHPGASDLCNGIDDDCDGEIDNGTRAQLQCVFIPSATGACVNGECVISACAEDHADCDGLITNGCEKNLDPVAGDCQITDCDDQSIVDESDRPRSETCHVGKCVDGEPVQEPVDDGTPCAPGKMCQAGVCVAPDQED